MATANEYLSNVRGGSQTFGEFLHPYRADCMAVYKYAFDVVGKRLGRFETKVSRWKNGTENPSERIKEGVVAAVKAGVPMNQLLVIAADLEKFIRDQYEADVTAQDVLEASRAEQQTQHIEDDAQMRFAEEPTPENAARLAFTHTVNAGADIHVASVASRYAVSAR